MTMNRYCMTSCMIIFLMFSGSALASRTMCGTYYDDYALPNLGYDEISTMPGYNSQFWNEAKSDIIFSNSWEQNDFTNDFYTGTRLMAALWLLKNAGDGNTPILDEAYDYVVHRTDYIEASCNVYWHHSSICSSTDAACNHYGGEEVDIDKDVLYKSHVLFLASILYHEARHSDQSTAQFIERRTHPGWSNGPYAYQVQWLSWFAAASAPIFSDEFRNIAGVLANNFAHFRNFDHAGSVRSNTGNNAGYVFNTYVNRNSSNKIPRLADNNCAHPNQYRLTSHLGNITADENSVRSYCGSCGVSSEPQTLPNGEQDYNNIDVSCSIGSAGRVVTSNPYSYPTPQPTPTPPPVSSDPAGSACSWSSTPSYGNSMFGVTYYEYPAIGACQHSLKKVTTSDGQVSITYSL